MGTAFAIILLGLLGLAVLLGLLSAVTNNFGQGRTPPPTRAEKIAAMEAARTLHGDGWKLTVAELDSVNMIGATMAVTAATITNTSSVAGRFRVGVVIRDASGTRLGTVSSLSDMLPPADEQLLTLRGSIAPLTTRRLGKVEFTVERL